MKKLLLSAMLGFTLLSGTAFAQSPDVEMLKKIQTQYPNLKVVRTTYSPDVKLYEIKVEGNQTVSFTNENIDYFILNGKIIDPKNKKDVSLERELASTKEFFNSLPFSESIPVKFGTGERKIAVFTDPDCPYCKNTDIAIHNQMVQDNITISYFMNPLNIPGHEQAPLKAKKIWCAPDKTQAWTKWMLYNELPQNEGTCVNPVEKNMKLSQDNGFTLTPILLFDNGIIWRGAIQPAQIREILEKFPAK